MGLVEFLLMPEAPGATLLLLCIVVLTSFASSSINRLLIKRFVGWEQYQRMQKEISEYRTQTSQAMRKKDKKLHEKLKKKEPQILNMQKKMAKPQIVLFAVSFSYLFIWWFVLLPVYGNTTVAYIPGIGGLPVFYWYMICSLFLGTVANRSLGIMPIE